MFRKNFYVFFLIAATLSAQTPTGRYTIVPEESRVEIQTGTAGLLKFAGHGHEIVPSTFSGEVTIQPPGQAGTNVRVRISSASLKETGDFSDKDKQEIESQMHDSVLEAAKFPEIAFQSTSVKYSESIGHVYDAVIEGQLSLHGIARKITVPARITQNGNLLRATGSFKIDRPDYKIETKSAGGGTVKVSKTIDINFEFVLKP
jgi:polyisoprenoid-binding protein YceI